MALETSAERNLAIEGGNDAVVAFLKRTATMVGEADSFINTLNTAKADLESAKTASDAAVADDASNAILASENGLIAAKITEIDAVLVQANAIKTEISALLAG